MARRVSIAPFDPTNPSAPPTVEGEPESQDVERDEPERLDEDQVIEVAQKYVEDAFGESPTPQQLTTFLEYFRRLESMVLEENGLA